MTPKEFVANLLAEVKLAEKRLAKAQEKQAPLLTRLDRADVPQVAIKKTA